MQDKERAREIAVVITKSPMIMQIMVLLVFYNIVCYFEVPSDNVGSLVINTTAFTVTYEQ